MQELKAGQEPQRSHLSAVEQRGVGSPQGAAGSAAPCFGLVLKARNFPSRAFARPFTASAAAAALAAYWLQQAVEVDVRIAKVDVGEDPR